MVFTTESNGADRVSLPLKQAVDVGGVQVWYFPLALNGLSFFYSPSLGKAVSKRVSEFDLVVADTLWGHALVPTALACTHHRTPYVIPVRGQLNPWALARKGSKKRLYMNFILKRHVDRAAGIHCTDSSEAAEVEKLGFRAPIFTVPNSIDTSIYSDNQRSGNLHRKFGIPANACILLFVGRLTHIKRPDVAVSVLAAAQSLKRETHLIVVGPDEDGLVPKLSSQAYKQRCYEKLHFTGIMEKRGVVSALSEADLLLVPSEIQENFGMSTLEGLASGVPVLVSEGIPVGKSAQMAGAGRVVPCGESAFQNAALELLSKPEELKMMGQRGRSLVQQHFDSKAIAQTMLNQYKAIVSTGRPLSKTKFTEIE